MSDWDGRFLSLAAHVAMWSKDPSTKCGAVIVRGDRTIASLGFNGFPRGVRDDPLLLQNREEKYKRVVHAEMNALLHLAERPIGCTLYTWPFPPCCRCATQVIQSGIQRVVSPIGEASLRGRHDVELSRAMFLEAGVQIEEMEDAEVVSSMRDVVTGWRDSVRRWTATEAAEQDRSTVSGAGSDLDGGSLCRLDGRVRVQQRE